MHPVWIAVLFSISIAAGGGAGFLYKKTAALSARRDPVPTALAVAPTVPFVCFAVTATVRGWQPTVVNVAAGIAGGGAFSAAVAMLMRSVARGDYGISVILVNLSFAIPIVVSALFLDDRASVLQIVGDIVLIAVIVLTNLPSRGKGSAPRPNGGLDPTAGGKSRVPWILCAVLACVFNGAVGVALKVQNRFSPGGEETFYAVMYATSCVIGLAWLGISELRRRSRSDSEGIVRGGNGKALLTSAGLGACVALSYYPQSLLAAHVNASVLFCVGTAGTILVSLAAGWIFLREKFGLRSAIALVCCALAIVLQVLPF